MKQEFIAALRLSLIKKTFILTHSSQHQIQLFSILILYRDNVTVVETQYSHAIAEDWGQKTVK